MAVILTIKSIRSIVIAKELFKKLSLNATEYATISKFLPYVTESLNPEFPARQILTTVAKKIYLFLETFQEIN